MIYQTFDIHDFIRVREVEPLGDTWPIPCPFNLRFSRQRLTASMKDAISGTGIYLLTSGLEVVYLGMFRPIDKDIITLRWARHLQTITGRGAKIGLGNGGERGPQKRLGDLLDTVYHPHLRHVLQTAYDLDQTKRFRSTGNDTTPNRLRFASERWDVFSAATPQTILDGLCFRLLRMRPAATQVDANMEIDRIERRLRAEYQPLCNSDYKHNLHAATRHCNTIPNLIDATKAAMYSVTSMHPTHCVLLAG